MNLRRRVGVFLGALLIALTTGFAIQTPANAAGSYYIIKLFGYDRCLDVRGVSTANGALLQTYSCIPGALNQKFYVTHTGAGNIYQLIAQHSYKCADVAGVSPYWGANIQQYDCLGANQQNQWWARNVQFYAGNGNAVVTWASFVDWCLSAQNWNNGADVRQEDCTGTGRNYWEMILAPIQG